MLPRAEGWRDVPARPAMPSREAEEGEGEVVDGECEGEEKRQLPRVLVVVMNVRGCFPRVDPVRLGWRSVVVRSVNWVEWV